MKSLFTISPPQYLGIVFALVCILTPASTFAAGNTPACTLTVTTSEGTEKVQNRKAEKILLLKGDEVRIEWKSSGAKKAYDTNGDSISLSGFATSAPSTTTTYTYKFTNGSRKATCTVEIQVVTGSITTSSIATSNTKPTIVGKASGTKSVQVKVYKEGSTKAIFTSKVIRVKNEAWRTTLSKKLPKGNYTVVLSGEKKVELNTIASSSLSVGAVVKKDKNIDTTLVIEAVPLLTGGFAHAGASVAISYLQLINVGKEPAPVKGIWLSQNGSASTESIFGFTVVDDLGISHGSVSNPIFKNTATFIPTDAILTPGQMLLFTIRAVVTSDVALHRGKQLKMDVASVESPATVRSQFPIRGTTWTIVD